MKKKKEELELALKRIYQSTSTFDVKTILNHIDFLTEQIEMLDQEVGTRVSSYQEDIERLDSIPGIATEWLNKSYPKLEQMLKINSQVRSYVFLGRISSWT